jgi:hypothetical protein
MRNASSEDTNLIRIGQALPFPKMLWKKCEDSSSEGEDEYVESESECDTHTDGQFSNV